MQRGVYVTTTNRKKADEIINVLKHSTNGIARKDLLKTVHISSGKLKSFLDGVLACEPIGHDDRLSDNLYWCE